MDSYEVRALATLTKRVGRKARAGNEDCATLIPGERTLCFEGSSTGLGGITRLRQQTIGFRSLRPTAALAVGEELSGVLDRVEHLGRDPVVTELAGSSEAPDGGSRDAE